MAICQGCTRVHPESTQCDHIVELPEQQCTPLTCFSLFHFQNCAALRYPVLLLCPVPLPCPSTLPALPFCPAPLPCLPCPSAMPTLPLCPANPLVYLTKSSKVKKLQPGLTCLERCRQMSSDLLLVLPVGCQDLLQLELVISFLDFLPSLHHLCQAQG